MPGSRSSSKPLQPDDGTALQHVFFEFVYPAFLESITCLPSGRDHPRIFRIMDTSAVTVRTSQEHQIRRSGHVVQDRPWRSLCWAIFHTYPCRAGAVRRLGSRFGSSNGVPALMVFKSMCDSLTVTTPTWTVSLWAYCVNQDHPAYIP